MNKNFKIFTALLFIVILIINKSNSTETDAAKIIKRTVAILPFYNLKKDKNDFYTNLIRDSVKARLQEKELYNIIEFGEIKKNIAKFNYDAESLNADELKAGNFAKTMKADIVIYGTFAVQKDKINISITAYDIIYKKSIVTVAEYGDTGLEIFNLINIKVGKTLADKMSGMVTMIDKTILDEIENRTRYIIEENDQNKIQELLKENEKYVRIDAVIQGKDFPLAIPRGYNIIIFIKDEPGTFEIKYNDQVYQSNISGLKIMVFENEIGAVRQFNLVKDEKESMIFNYVQKRDSEITIKRIKFKKDSFKFTMLRNEKSYFVSSSILTGITGLTLLSGIITAGIMGYYIDLYNRTPIEEPEKISVFKEYVYTLFPASIILFSISASFLVPSILFWGFYGYCLYLKKEGNMKKFSLEIITGHKFIGLAVKIKLN